MSRETRAIANANHILNTLERFPTADIHSRNYHIGHLKSWQHLIKIYGPTERRLTNLEKHTEEAEEWLVECTMERMEGGR